MAVPAARDRASPADVILGVQRGQGNQAATRAARSLRGRGGGKLLRSFGTLDKDLRGEVKTELKVLVPADKVEKLDMLWKARMRKVTPLEFVRNALAGLPAPKHDRLYLNFELTGGGSAVLFEIKFEEIVETEGPERPPLPPGTPHTRLWRQIGARRWARTVAGATRTITFGDAQLTVDDTRTDAPTGVPGGSGYTRRLFKNLLEMYAAETPRTVINITADEEGRYVWARYGFLPDAAEWKQNIRDKIVAKANIAAGANLAEKLAACAQGHGPPISEKDAATMAAALQREDPLALFDLVDVAAAKDFLWWLFTSGIVDVWHGRLELTDPVQGPRVRRYIGLPLPITETPTVEVVTTEKVTVEQ